MRSARSCSGAAYSGVMAAPARCVSAAAESASPSSLAMPKSSSFTCPSASTRMFEGLRSRCTTRCLCACSTAESTCRNNRCAHARPAGEHRSEASRSSPSTYSSAMNGWPDSVTPASYRRAMFGCVSAASASRSRANRSASVPSSENNGILRATWRLTTPSARSASQTTDMPPRPSSRFRRYPASTSPDARANGSSSSARAKPANTGAAIRRECSGDKAADSMRARRACSSGLLVASDCIAASRAASSADSSRSSQSSASTSLTARLRALRTGKPWRAANRVSRWVRRHRAHRRSR